MKRIGVLWIDAQDLPIQLLGLLQPTSLMVLKCDIQRLRRR